MNVTLRRGAGVVLGMSGPRCSRDCESRRDAVPLLMYWLFPDLAFTVNSTDRAVGRVLSYVLAGPARDLESIPPGGHHLGQGW